MLKPAKSEKKQLWVDNSNVKYYFNNSTSYVKILAVSLVFFLLGIGNNLGQTFTTIGTSNGANTNVSYPCPLADYYENHRTQYLIRASELTAAGIPSGANISSIRFNVTATNSTGVIERLSIYVGGTTTSSLGTAFLTAPIQRYGPIDYTPGVGNNTFSFSSNYTWNGTDNILVQICNGSSAATAGITYTNNASVSWQTGLTFNASYSNRVDDNNLLCATSTVTGSQTTRPLITFGWTMSPIMSNDLVCNATAISCGQTLSGTTVNSTLSGTGEGLNCVIPQTMPGVWFSTLGNGQTITSSLCGTTWDSKLSVFSGSTCSSLTCVGGNDDAGPSCSGVPASYSWNSVSGVNYYILVHGYNSNSAFSLNLSCTGTAPSNPTGILISETSGNNSNDGIICSGTSTQLSVSGSSGTTYWFSGSCGNSTANSIGSGTNLNVTPTTTTTYFARNYSNGQWSLNCTSATVTVNPSPSVNAGSDQTVCAGTSVTLSGSGANTYSWSNSISNNVSFVPSTTATYTVTGTNTSTGCINSDQVIVTVNPLPSTPSTPTSNSPQCSSVTITRSGTPPTGITWYWQGTNNNGTSTSLGSGVTYSATSSGTYYLRAQNSTGCWSNASASIIVSITNTPQAPNNPTSNSPQCTSSTITRSGTPPTGTTWYWQGTNSNDTSTSLGSGATYTATTSGTYYIRALNSSGCWSSTSGSVTIVISGIPSLPSINTTSATCYGPGTATISNYNSSQSYNFSPSGPSVSANGEVSGMTYNTVYTVVTLNSTNCQSGSSNSFSITPALIVPSTPAINVIASSCTSNGTASISNYDNSQTYSFTPIGPVVNSIGSILSTTTGIAYTVATSNSNCISNPSQVFTIQNQLLVPNTPGILSSSANQNICDSILITRNSNPPTGVSWYWQGTNPSGTSTSFGSSASYFAQASGTYYLRALSSDGCWSNSSSSIQVYGGRPSNPTNPISNAPQCDTMIVSFNGSPANGVTWYWQGTSPNSALTIFGSSDSIFVTTSGTYYLRALSSLGCWSLGTGLIQVNVGRPSTPNVLISNSPNCEQVIINRTGVVPSLTGWYWQGTNPNGVSTLYSGPSFIVTSSGTYYLRAKNLNNCWSNQSAIINVVVYESSIEEQQVTNCGAYNWIDGNTYSSDTIVSYIYPQPTVNGCDSSVQLILNINPINFTMSDIMACESYTWIDGNTYFSDTLVPAITLNSIYGCDSLVSLNLIIGQPLIDTTIIDTTANQSLVYNGIAYSESGTYYQTLADQFGCDSIVQLNLIIENSDLNNLENMNLTIYPNPSLDGRFFIKTDSQFELIKLIDFSGREVNYIFQDNLLDLNNLSRGVYFAIGKIDGELIQFKLVHSD